MAFLGRARGRATVPTFRNNRVLQQYVLADVTPTGKILGTGSFGSVLEVTYGKLNCAAKKMHDTLVLSDNQGAETLVQKYEQECQIMASLRHPNITQFLGICYLPDTQLPLLVMEQLDMSLDELLEYVPSLPLTLKISFLEDICGGLHYLHTRNPPIVHRDLTAKNVLLTSSLSAKITDMGNSRIISLKPGQLARTLSQLPGTLVYMPPEALSDEHRYGPSLDIFSIGHLALFTLIQVFPGNLLPYTYRDPNNQERVQGRTEIERRATYIQSLEASTSYYSQSLVDLVKQCLHDAPEERPPSEDLLERIHAIKIDVEQSCGGSSLNIVDIGRVKLAKDMKRSQEKSELEMRAQIEEKIREIEELQQETERLHGQLLQQEDELQQQREEIQQQREEIQRQEDQVLQKSGEVQQKTEEIQQLRDEMQHKDEELRNLSEDLAEFHQKKEEVDQMNIDLQKSLSESKKKEDELRLEVSRLEEELRKYQDQLHSSKKSLSESKGKEDELRLKVSRLEEELRKCQDQLHSPKEIKLPLQVKWTRGPDMPFTMQDYIQSVTIQETVYVGGGYAGLDSPNNYIVMVYNTHSCKWHQLPPYTARNFAMVVINNQLVLVGGKDNKEADTNLLSMWDTSSRRWTSPYTRMPTPCAIPSAVVYKQWLIVAGVRSDGHSLSTIEVLDSTSNQWHSAPPTPTPRGGMKSTILGDMWYLMGGYMGGSISDFDIMYSVSLPDLISHVISSTSSSSHHHMWKKISGLGHYYSTPLCVGGYLLAVGGKSIKDKKALSTIHRYIPENEEWIEVGQLPHPTYNCACTFTLEQLFVFGGHTKPSVCHIGTIN